MKFLTPLILGSLISFSLYSQNYTRDAGVRFGNQTTFSYRQYQDDSDAYELMLSASWRSLRFTAMKEFFIPAFMQFSDNINFVYGYGAHAGFIYSNDYRFLFRTYKLNEWKFSPVFGLDAILGLEYNLHDIPIIFGIDFKPNFEFSTTRFFYIFLNNASLSIKYKF